MLLYIMVIMAIPNGITIIFVILIVITFLIITILLISVIFAIVVTRQLLMPSLSLSIHPSDPVSSVPCISRLLATRGAV